jgi:hypothetical protein
MYLFPLQVLQEIMTRVHALLSALPPPILPTPQSPKIEAISSRNKFARRPGVSESGVGAWSCRWVDSDGVNEDDDDLSLG